jgi:phosphate transport system permease protein
MTTSEIAAPGGRTGSTRSPLEAASPRIGEKLIYGFLMGCGIVAVVVTIAIVLSLLFPAIGFFQEVSIVDFLTGTTWTAGFANPEYGVLPLVVGTLHIVFWSLLVGIPVGLFSAFYLSEYAPQRLRRIVKPILEMLAGIPTVAIGLFALLYLRPLAEDVTPFLPWGGPFSIGVAGVAVGLLTIPLIASVSDDAMRAVPAGLRQGAYALGASKLRVCLRVVFPAAISGIIASIVLAASRAVGETMVVLLASGGTANLTLNPTEPALPMTAYIGSTATGEIATGTVQYDTIFAVGSLLFVLTLAMNLVAIRLVRRFRQVY